MKKRLLSIFTALIMVCSIIGVMPKIEMKVEAAAYSWPLSTNYPITNGYTVEHGGCDMAVPLGSPVYAVAAGTATVIDRGCLGSHYGGKPACSNGLSCGAYKNGSTYGSYGNHIKIDHGNGVITYYCHLSTGIPISNGKSVQQGELIGYSGTSGKSTGPHLHFEIRVNGSRNNPSNYLTKTNVNPVPPKPINTPVDTNYKTPFYNVTPKNTSGLTLVYNSYGIPYSTSVHNIAPGDNCTIHEIYKTGFCKVTYPTSKGNHTEYAKTADFNLPNPVDPDPRFAPYMPLTAYLWENKTAYVATGEIWTTDKCIITAVYKDGTCDVTYPVSGGTKNVRTSLSIFIPNTSANFEKVNASGQILAYSRPDMSANIGYTDPGDPCVKVATSGDKVQIIYPISGGYKIGFVYASQVPHTHSFGSWLTTQNASCTATGISQRKCSTCGHTETQTINKTSHNMGGWVTKNATCTVNGNKTRSCTSCGYKETQTIAKTGHKYTSKVVAATCKDKGYTQYTCSVCKHTYKDKYTNVTTSHKWGNWTTSKNATCTADGSKTRKCSVCGKSETQTIAKLGHSMSDWTIKNATCTTDGSKTRSCTRNGCTHKETQTIAKTNHKYTSKIVLPTCTAKGYTLYTCECCGNTYKDNETAAYGHKWGDWIISENATCTAEGIKTRKCSVCEKNETQTIGTSGDHKYTSKIIAPTCTSKGYTLYTCECGDSYKDNYTNTTPHNHIVREVISPTCKKEGYTVYECSVCGVEHKDDYVKPTGHKYKSEEFNPGNGREPFTLLTCIHCKGSYKDTVSKKHKGDFDKDGTLKVSDAVFMKKILTKSHKPTFEEIMIADVNQDGAVNVFDMIIVKRTLMNSK